MYSNYLGLNFNNAVSYYNNNWIFNIVNDPFLQLWVPSKHGAQRMRNHCKNKHITFIKRLVGSSVSKQRSDYLSLITNLTVWHTDTFKADIQKYRY